MPRVPTEKDFEILLQDAEQSGALDDVVKEKKIVKLSYHVLSNRFLQRLPKPCQCPEF